MDFVTQIKNVALNNLPFIFTLLRNTFPILRLKNITVVSRYSDVQEVLSRSSVFGVTYGNKMQTITDGSNFFLGMDDSPEYTRDVSNMRLVFRGNDVDKLIVPLIENLCAKIVSNSNGSIDAVQELTRIVPAQFTQQYMGVASPDYNDLIDWTTAMFQYLFYPENPPGFDQQAIEYAKYTRQLLDGIISDRKSQQDNKDDILARCLALQSSNTPGMTDIDIRNNLLGIIIGAIPTTSKCAALVIDYLLDNPEHLATAQAAAKRDDTETIRKVVLESLRFNSFGAGVFRTALESYTVARGSFRAKKITKGATVIVLTQSAMRDGRKINNRNSFRLDRPDYQYMHFGYGKHSCFGEFINMVQIPIIVKSLLKCNNLRRQAGELGVMQYSGEFPSSLKLQFDQPAKDSVSKTSSNTSQTSLESA